jgi:hypothetical protein
MRNILLAILALSMVSATPAEQLAIVNIAAAGPSKLGNLKNLAGVSWWTEIGGSLLVSVTPAGLMKVKKTGFATNILASEIAADDLRVIVAAHDSKPLPAGSVTLADEGRIRLIEGDSGAIAVLDQMAAEKSPALGVFPVEAGRVVLQLQSNQTPTSKMSSRHAAMLTDAAGKVSRERWWGDVQKLAGWNRHISAAGNIQARDWIKSTLGAIPGMEVTVQEFKVQGRAAWNVVGILTGERLAQESGVPAAADRGLLIVGGHFDSTSERTSSAAPGAEDNASGAAGVIELARVMAETPHSQDIIFVAFSGEEQGLYGSAAFVDELPDLEKERIRGVLTMDMIAYAKGGNGGPLGVLIETESEHAAFARHFTDAAAAVTKLQVSTSYNPFGSDHVSFLDAGLPAILAIDADWNRYGHYHRSTDTPDKLTPELAHEILKMNAGALALLTH